MKSPLVLKSHYAFILAAGMTLFACLSAAKVWANEAPKKTESESGHKSTAKKGSAADAAAAKASAAEKSASSAAEAPAERKFTKGPYFNRWVTFPDINGKSVMKSEPISIQKQKGTAYVVIFIASWCVACQELMPRMQEIQKKYADLNTNVIFLFSHDTDEDAINFSKKNNIVDGIHANDDMLKFFHNPSLPSVFVGDRHGWLSLFQPKTTRQNLDELDSFLNIISAI